MYPFLALALLVSRSVYAADSQKTLCDVSAAVIDIPSGQTNISVPANAKPNFIAVGLGTQNYTCSDSGTYTSVGAVAELLDISCFVQDPVFTQLRKRAPFPDGDEVWAHEAQVRALLGPQRLRLGQHYFITNPVTGQGISPKFDFTTDLFTNDSNAFITNTKIGNLAAKNSTQDVDLLQLGNLQGSLADFTFRIDTHFGQPPESCQPGSQPIQVRYSAKYWFFKNSTSSAGGSSNGSGTKASTLNALSDGDTDPATIQKLLNYAPIVLGLLGVTTILSLILVVLGIFTLCRRRRSSGPTRSAAYRPVQLPRAKTPMDGGYKDDLEPYGA